MAEYIQQFNLQEYLARTRAAQQATTTAASGLDYNELLQQQYARTNAPVGQQVQQTQQPQQQKQAGILETGFDTVTDFATNVFQGLWGLPEGIVDFLAGGVAGIGEAFGADTTGIQDFISNTWADDAARLTTAALNIGGIVGDAVVGSLTEKDFSFEQYAKDVISGARYADGSLLQGTAAGEFVAGVAQGIGQLLPAIALAPLTGGLSAAAVSGIQIGTYSLSAAGKGVEEALNQEADIGTALAYGTLSGAVEGLIESFSGGVGGTLTGPSVGLLQKLMGKEAVTRLASNAIAKTAVNALAEGFEEAVSEAVNPLLKKWTYAPETEYDLGEVAKNAATSFASSFISSFIVSGAQVMRAGKTTKINGKSVGANGVYAAQNYQEAEQSYTEEQKKLDPIVQEVKTKYGDRAFVEDENGPLNLDGKRYSVNTKVVASYDADAINNQISKIEEGYQNVQQWETELNRIWEKNGITKEDQARESTKQLDSTLIVLQQREKELRDAGKVNEANAVKIVMAQTLAMKGRTEGSYNNFETVSAHLKKNKYKVSKKTMLTEKETASFSKVGYQDAAYKITYTDENGGKRVILFNENDVPLNYIESENTRFVGQRMDAKPEDSKKRVNKAKLDKKFEKSAKSAIIQVNKMSKMFPILQKVQINVANKVLRTIRSYVITMEDGFTWADVDAEDQQYTARVIGFLQAMIEADVSEDFTKILTEAFGIIVPKGQDKWDIESFKQIKGYITKDGYNRFLDLIGAKNQVIPLTKDDATRKPISLSKVNIITFLEKYANLSSFYDSTASQFDADFLDILQNLKELNEAIFDITEIFQKKGPFDLTETEIENVNQDIIKLTQKLAYATQYQRIATDFKIELEDVLSEFKYEDSQKDDDTFLYEQDLLEFLQLPKNLKDVNVVMSTERGEVAKVDQTPYDERPFDFTQLPDDDAGNKFKRYFVVFDGVVNPNDAEIRPTSGKYFTVYDSLKQVGNRPFIVVELPGSRIEGRPVLNEDMEETGEFYDVFDGKRVSSRLEVIPVEFVKAANPLLVKKELTYFSTRLDVEKALAKGMSLTETDALVDNMVENKELDVDEAAKLKYFIKKIAKRVVVANPKENLEKAGKPIKIAAPKSINIPKEAADIVYNFMRGYDILVDDYGAEILDDPELAEFLYLGIENLRDEKSDVAEPMTAEQRKLLKEGKNLEFSRARGYTEEQIAKFKRYVELYQILGQKYDSDFAFEYVNPEAMESLYDEVNGKGAYQKKQEFLLGKSAEANEVIQETAQEIKQEVAEQEKLEEKKPVTQVEKIIKKAKKETKAAKPKKEQVKEEKREKTKSKWQLDAKEIKVTPPNEQTYKADESKFKIVQINGEDYVGSRTSSYTDKNGNTIYASRGYAIVEYDGVKIPFYLSSGENIKSGVTPGRWYPIYGIGTDQDGFMTWINKGSSENIRAFNGVTLLRAMGEFLQDKIGDVRIAISDKYKTQERELTKEELDIINEGLKPGRSALPKENVGLFFKRVYPVGVKFWKIYKAYKEAQEVKQEQFDQVEKVKEKEQKDESQKKPVQVKVEANKVEINIKGEETQPLPPSNVAIFTQPKAEPKAKEKVRLTLNLVSDMGFQIQSILNEYIDVLTDYSSRLTVYNSFEELSGDTLQQDRYAYKELIAFLKNYEVGGVKVFKKIVEELYDSNKFASMKAEDLEVLKEAFMRLQDTELDVLVGQMINLKQQAEGIRINNLEKVQWFNYYLKNFVEGLALYNKNFGRTSAKLNYEMLIIDTIVNKKGDELVIPQSKLFPKSAGFFPYQSVRYKGKSGYSILTKEQLFRSTRDNVLALAATDGQRFVLLDIEAELQNIRANLQDPSKEGYGKLTPRQSRWFKNGEYSEDLRVAVILYTRGQAPQTRKEISILTDFMIDFGVAEIAKPRDGKEKKSPLKDAQFAMIDDETHNMFITMTEGKGYVVNPEKLPTFVFGLRERLNRYNTNLVLVLQNQQPSSNQPFYGAWIDNVLPRETGIGEIVLNMYDLDNQNPPNFTMQSIHEVLHLILMSDVLDIKDQDIRKELREAKIDLINTMIRIKDYLKRTGQWQKFLESVMPYYQGIENIEDPFANIGTDNVSPMHNTSIQEEAFAHLFSFGLAFDYKQNSFITSEITALRRRNPIFNNILTWGEEQDVGFNIKKQPTYKLLSNIEQTKPLLEDKIKTEPVRPKTTFKGELKSNSLEFIIRTQNAQAAIEQFFALTGNAEKGRVAVNQARAAKNAGQQSISYGIYDRKTGKFLSKPLFGKQKILNTLGPGNMKPGILDFLIDKDPQYFAKFSVYAFLHHNLDRADLKEKAMSTDLKFQGTYTEDTERRIRTYIINKSNYETGNVSEETQTIEQLREKIDNGEAFEVTPELLNELLDKQVITQEEYNDMDYQITYIKEIFGKFISIADMPEYVQKRIEEEAPQLYKALVTGAVLNINDFHEFADLDRADYAQSGRDLKSLTKLIKELENTYMRSINKEQTKQLIASYEKDNPEFVQAQKDLVEWYDALLTVSVDAQLISPDEAAYFRKTYKNYIPTIREAISLNAIKGASGKTNLNVRNPIKTAKGSDLILESIDAVAARRTMFTHHAAQMNILMNAMWEAYQASGETPNDFILSVEQIQAQRRTSNKQEILESSPLFDSSSAGDFITFFRINEDGEKVSITVKVSKLVFDGFKQLNNSFDDTAGIVGNVAKALNNGFKSLITNYNPLFIVRNFLRDIQDATFYSQFGFGKLLKQLPEAWRAMYNNDPLWQEYAANGGQYSSIFDYNEGIRQSSNYARTRLQKGGKFKFLRKMSMLIERANIFVEQGTRFAEYMLARQSGQSIEQSIFAANEVTVNFGRTGTLTQKLNSTVMPFLNPSVQGLDRQLRVFMSPKGAKEWANLLLKLILLGILPQLFNDIIYAGDDAYNVLPDYVKEQNYLIKVGNQFIKIPKGRAAGSVQNVYLGIQSGKPIGEITGSIWEQLNPTNNFRTVFSPFADVANNRTWFGGEIVSTKWRFTRPENQYTDETSYAAIYLGKLLGYSPLKIDYLFDQFGGVLYDVFANRAPINSLLLDPTYTNAYSNKFYDALTKLNYDRTDGDVIARAQVAYLNRVIDNIGEIYKSVEEVNSNPSLSDAEKKKQQDILQVMINEAYNQAVINVEKFGDELQAYELSETSYDEDVLAATRNVFGAEYALRYYNYRVHEKAQIANAFGFNFEQYFDYYFAVRTIEGKDNIVSFINSLDTNQQVKQLLYKFAGYKLEDSTIRQLYTLLINEGAPEDLVRSVLSYNEEV